MLTLRKVLFYVFLLIYLILCPWIILHALGISFKPGTHGLIKTGLIYIASLPAGAEVYVNNRHLPRTTPALIRNLKPGEYTVRLELAGHMPWQKTLTVKEEKAVTADNILLFPVTWASHPISALAFERLIPIEQEPLILLGQGETLKDFFVYKWGEGFSQALLENVSPKSTSTDTLRYLVSRNSPLLDAKIINTLIMPNSPYLLVESAVGEEHKYFWLDLKNKLANIQDISILFPSQPDITLWHSNDERNLFTLVNGHINRANLESKAIYPNIVNNVLSFGVFDRHIYALHKDFTFSRYDQDGNLTQTLLEDPELGQLIFGESRGLTVHVLTDKLMLFLDDKGRLISNRLPHILVDRGVEGFLYNETQKYLLVWTKERIGVLDLLKEPQEAIFEKGLQLEWIVTDGRDIRQAFWVNNGSQVIYRDENHVLIVDASDQFGQPQPQFVTTVRPGSSIAYADTIGQLFYLETETGHIRALDILPQGKPHILLTIDKLDARDTTIDAKENDGI